MSAVNIIRDADTIHIFTDAAGYDATGRLRSLGQKVYAIPHLSCAIACRGPSIMLALAAAHIEERFHTFDALVGGLVEALRDTATASADLLSACEIGDAFDFFLAGWSESRDAAESYIVCSHDSYVRPWELVPLDRVALSPFDEALAASLERDPPGGKAADSIPHFGLAVMERQRGIVAQNAGGGPAMKGVGGFCQWTVISRQSVQSSILKYWPDQIGEPIGLEVMALGARMKGAA